MSPMLLRDDPRAMFYGQRRWHSGFRFGLVLGNIGGAAMATALWWLLG